MGVVFQKEEFVVILHHCSVMSEVAEGFCLDGYQKSLMKTKAKQKLVSFTLLQWIKCHENSFSKTFSLVESPDDC